MKRFKIWENHLERRWRSFHVLVYHHGFLLKPTFLSWNLACPKYRNNKNHPQKRGKTWKTAGDTKKMALSVVKKFPQILGPWAELGSSPDPSAPEVRLVLWISRLWGAEKRWGGTMLDCDSVIRFPPNFGIFGLMIPQNLWKTGKFVSFFQLELFFCSINGKDQSFFFVEWGGS